MALPTSPTVVVLENDASIYAPNVDSSIVGIIGFADKGPIDEATLITSQNNLLNTFGKPSSNIPGQGLEAAIEILEATNKVYFVRADNGTATQASAVVSLGFSPAVKIPTTAMTATSSIYYALTDGYGTSAAGKVVTITYDSASTTTQLFRNYFNPELINDSEVFAQTDDSGNLYLVSRFAGSSSRLQVSSAAWTVSALNYNGSAITGSTNVIASGGTAVNSGVSSLYLLAQPIYKGSGYSLSSLRDGSIVGLSIEVDSKSFRDRVIVNSEGSEREAFLVELTPSSPASVEYILNTDVSLNNSEYINAQILASGSAFTINNNPAELLGASKAFTYGGSTQFGTPRFVKIVEGTYSVTGGQSGYSTTEVGTTLDYTGLVGSQTSKTGLYAIDDESLNISIALIPGITSQTVQNALITLAEQSKSFIAIVAPPYGLDTPQDAVEWVNGKQVRTAAINSSYAAIYWPWLQVFNPIAGADEWYDPSIFAARQYVYTDNVSEPWFAPAGFRRGRLTKPTDTEVRLNQGDKDTLYVNNINPISKENQYGITIIGQKTAQRLPSALNSVNVRRLMIEIRKVLLILGKPFQMEPNDEFTWELVEDSIKPFLDDLLARRAITEGSVKCDSTTNTPLRVDRKELWCSVSIKPTLAAETVVFEVNLTNQSATING